MIGIVCIIGSLVTPMICLRAFLEVIVCMLDRPCTSCIGSGSASILGSLFPYDRHSVFPCQRQKLMLGLDSYSLFALSDHHGRFRVLQLLWKVLMISSNVNIG